MEEDPGRSSPPLPSRGSYNLDFDNLDDSFNPFQTKKDIQHSPPPVRKSPAADGRQPSEDAPAVDAEKESQPSEESLLKADQTPKRKKSKSPSSKRTSEVPETDKVECQGEGGEEGAETQLAEKRTKPKKVVKKKPRPSSKNLEAQGTSEKPPPSSNPQGESGVDPSTNDQSTAQQALASTEPQAQTGTQPQAPAKELPQAPVETEPHSAGFQEAENDSTVIPPADIPSQTTENIGSATVENTSLRSDTASQERDPATKEKPEENDLEQPHKKKASKQPLKKKAQENASKQPAKKKPHENVSELPQEDLSCSEKHESSAEKAPESGKTTSETPQTLTEKPQGDTSTEKPQRDAPTKPQGDAPTKPQASTENSRSESTPEKPAPSVDTSQDGDKTPHLADKVQQPASAAVSEEGVRSTPKKERSGGKGRKSKSHSKTRKSGTSPRTSASEGTADGAGKGVEDSVDASPHGKETKARKRANSHGDGEIEVDSSVDADSTHNSKHPAARLLEQQLQDHSSTSSLGKGDSNMGDGPGTESVVKLVQVLKYSQSDWNRLRQELELDFQAQLLAKEREWSSKLADRDARLVTLDDTNKKLRQTNDDMRAVMAEFEKTIGQLQSEKERSSNASQQSLQDVIKERDQALEDLQSVETAFSDLHRRYEKTKGVVDGFKQNEETLKKCVSELQSKLKKSEQKVHILKEQAEEKLEKATEEIEKVHKATSSEIAKLEAALRKADLQVQSMESSLEQKIRENKELAAICDELIAKVQ